MFHGPRTPLRLLTGFAPHRFLDRRVAVAVFVVVNAALGLSLFAWYRPVPATSVLSLVRGDRLVPLTSATGHADWPALSTDGWLAYQVVPVRGRTPLDGARIVVALLAGETLTAAHEVGPGYRPAWSPDGRWLTFWRHGDDGGSLWLLSRDGSEPRLVSRQAIDAGYRIRPATVPIGSPTAWAGSTLAFTVRHPDNTYAIHALDVTTADEPAVLRTFEAATWPSDLTATAHGLTWFLRQRSQAPRAESFPLPHARPASSCAGLTVAPPRGQVFGVTTCAGDRIVVVSQTSWNKS